MLECHRSSLGSLCAILNIKCPLDLDLLDFKRLFVVFIAHLTLIKRG